MIELILKWAVPALCSAIAAATGGYFAGKAKRTKSVEAGMQCLLRLEIIRSYEHYTLKGHCPIYAREALTRGYNAYHNLGGNDVATDLYEKLIDLPTKEVAHE